MKTSEDLISPMHQSLITCNEFTCIPYFLYAKLSMLHDINLSGLLFWCCRGQFNHGESSKQASGKKNAVPNSAKSKKQSKKTNVEEVAQGSGSWVNPKSSTKIPKNAGKRRVQACGQSTQSAGQSTRSVGHWYTGSDGKRVSKSSKCVCMDSDFYH